MPSALATLAALLETQLLLSPQDLAQVGRGGGFPGQAFQALKLLEQITTQQSTGGGPSDLLTVWASPNGNDNKSGSVLEPVKTLQRAHDIALELVPNDDVVVRLSPGEFAGATITHRRLGIIGSGPGESWPGTRITTPVIYSAVDASYGVDSGLIREADLLQGIDTDPAAPGIYAGFMQNGLILIRLGCTFPGATTIRRGANPTGPFVLNDVVMDLGGGPLNIDLDEIVTLTGIVQGGVMRHTPPTASNWISVATPFLGGGGIEMANAAYASLFFNCTLETATTNHAGSSINLHACSGLTAVVGPGNRNWFNTPAFGTGPPGPGTHTAYVGQTYVGTAVVPPAPLWLYRQTTAPFGSVWVPAIHP